MSPARDYAAGYSGDGFEIGRRAPGDAGLSIRIRHWSPELPRVLRASGAARVVIDRFWEDRGTGLTFLTEAGSQIKSLSVAAEYVAGLSVVEGLTNVEELSLECASDGLDLGRLRRLRKCLLAHPASLETVAVCRTLEDLALFELRITDLAGLRPLRRLRRLHLNQLRRLVSLEGIEALPVRDVDLLYAGRLRSVAPLARLRRLTSLLIAGCKNVRDAGRIGEISSLRVLRILGGPLPASFTALGRLADLRELRIGTIHVDTHRRSVGGLTKLRHLQVLSLAGFRNVSDVGRLGGIRTLEALYLDRGPTLRSLKFLSRLTRLRELGVARTRIVDGDFSCLLDLPRLDRVHTLRPHRAHYSHTAAALNAALAARL